MVSEYLGLSRISRVITMRSKGFQLSRVNTIRSNLFVLRFYGPVNPVGSCREQSVSLTSLLLDRLSPPSG